MSAIIRVCVSLSCAVSAGCATQIKVEPISDPRATGAGIVYFLPMAEYEVTLTRQLTRCDSFDSGDPSKDLRAAVKITAALTTRYVQDPQKAFLLQYDALSGPTKTTDLSIDLYENGTLKSINAEAVDETRQVVANVFSGVSSLALSSAGLTISRVPAEGREELCPTTVRSALTTFEKSENLIASLEDEIAGLRMDIQDNLKDPKRLKELRAALAKAEAGLTAQFKQRKSTLDLLVDTQVYLFRPVRSKQVVPLEPSDALKSKWFTAYARGKGVDAVAVAAVAAEGGPVALPTPAPQTASLCPSDSSKLPCRPIHYRQPAAGLIRICRGDACYDAGGNPVADAHILLVAASSVPQLGVESTLLFRNGPFQNNSLKVTFLPSGGLEKFQAKTKASATEATASFKETAEAVAKYRSEKRNEDKQKLNEETDKLKAEKAKLDAQLELEKSRKALEAFRAE
jgi:hypothetical protein